MREMYQQQAGRFEGFIDRNYIPDTAKMTAFYLELDMKKYSGELKGKEKLGKEVVGQRGAGGNLVSLCSHFHKKLKNVEWMFADWKGIGVAMTQLKQFSEANV